MGGLMSGNPNCRKHDSTANRIRLDSYTFAEHVYTLRESGRKSVSATVNWGDESSIAVFIYQDRVTLKYKRTSTGESVSADYTLSFEPNRYGGRERVYFLCPCGQRARYLYIDRKGFVCRQCASLTYPSQRVTKGNSQCVLKMRKAAEKLIPEARTMAPIDLEYARPSKPKGMRWDTYYRYLAALYKAQREYTENFIGTVKRRFRLRFDD